MSTFPKAAGDKVMYATASGGVSATVIRPWPRSLMVDLKIDATGDEVHGVHANDLPDGQHRVGTYYDAA